MVFFNPKAKKNQKKIVIEHKTVTLIFIINKSGINFSFDDC